VTRYPHSRSPTSKKEFKSPQALPETFVVKSTLISIRKYSLILKPESQTFSDTGSTFSLAFSVSFLKPVSHYALTSTFTLTVALTLEIAQSHNDIDIENPLGKPL